MTLEEIAVAMLAGAIIGWFVGYIQGYLRGRAEKPW